MREHAKAVREAGHRVVVLHLAGSGPELTRRLWSMEEELSPSLSEGIETHHVFHRRSRVPGASYAFFLSSAIGACRRVRGGGFRPDVIHAHVYGAAVPAALVARRSRTRTPLVITEHFSGVAQRSLSRVEARKARYAYNRAARILPVSRFLQDAIRSYGVGVPFEVIPNVVDTSIFFPPGEPQKTAKRRLLFVGNLEPLHYKGFPTLLHALVRLDESRYDWQLDVIGDGTERLHYETSATALGMAERVTFHGSQSKRFVAEAMQAVGILFFSCPAASTTFLLSSSRCSRPDFQSSRRQSEGSLSLLMRAAACLFRPKTRSRWLELSTRRSRLSTHSTEARLPRLRVGGTAST